MKDLDTGLSRALSYKGVDQMGFVVEDMARGMGNFSEKLGIKEWYRPSSAGDDNGKIFYRGKEVSPRIDFVLGYCGKLQFELITTAGDRNIYTEHLEDHGEGFHHIGFFVSDLDRKLTAYAKMGIEPIQSGEVGGKGGAVTRYVYLDPVGANGLIIELIETKLFGVNTRMSPFMMKLGHITGDLVKAR